MEPAEAKMIADVQDMSAVLHRLINLDRDIFMTALTEVFAINLRGSSINEFFSVFKKQTIEAKENGTQ